MTCFSDSKLCIPYTIVTYSYLLNKYPMFHDQVPSNYFPESWWFTLIYNLISIFQDMAQTSDICRCRLEISDHAEGLGHCYQGEVTGESFLGYRHFRKKVMFESK